MIYTDIDEGALYYYNNYMACTNMSQLIILGNGFDLSCGLRSRYTDFYQTRPSITQVFALEPQYRAAANVWDVILGADHKTQEEWSGIEDAMKDWVTVSQVDLREPRTHIELVAQYLATDNFSELPVCNGLFNSRAEYIVAYYLRYDPFSNFDYTAQWRGLVPQIQQSFLYWLKEYQREFQSYLGEELRSKVDDYRMQARQRIIPIIMYGSSETSINQIHSASILNFNFTLPFWNECVPEYNVSNLQEEFCACQNVHGTLAVENSFFGIDGKDFMGDENLIPFTKTYQLIHTKGKRYTGILTDHHFSIIKFFGHSMGEADYSYFQAIFDAVDLYHSTTKIVVFYSPDVPNDLEVKTKQLIKLLYTYGATLDNKDHGKNLIHKMALEDRLEVTQLPSDCRCIIA